MHATAERFLQAGAALLVMHGKAHVLQCSASKDHTYAPGWLVTESEYDGPYPASRRAEYTVRDNACRNADVEDRLFSHRLASAAVDI